MKTEASSIFPRLVILFFSIWREIGIFLLTISLFLLPWFRDFDPPANRSDVITGVEFLTYGAWPVILGYAAACLSYIVSKFSNRKWVGVIILVMTCLFYLYLHLAFAVNGVRYDPPGVPLGRTYHLEAEEKLPAMIGMWVNWLGLVFLTVGLYLAERGRGRTAVCFAGVGALLGFCLLVGSVFTGMALPELVYNLTFLPYNIRNDDTLYQLLTWVQIFGLTLGGAVLGTWLALKNNRPVTNSMMSLH